MRVLIVGCGSIGRRHLANLRALVPDVEILAFRRGGEAGDLAERFGLRAVPSLDDGLAARPDFAIVSNPTAFHVPVARAAVRAGVPVFIEKPLADRREGVAELVRAVAAARLPSLVAYNLRFHPGLRWVRSLLADGRIGRLLALRAEVGQYLPDWHPGEDYRQGYSARAELGGGVVLDLSHELDYARWLGGPVAGVVAMAGKVSDLAIDTEDLAEIVLRFESGALGSVHLDYLQRPPTRGCRLVGSRGVLAWDSVANEVRLYEAGRWTTFRQEGFERNDMYRDEMAHFLECLAGRARPAVDVAEGALVLELALAARRSAASGRAVVPGSQEEDR